MVNLRVFRAYFPLGRTICDSARFPLDYLRGDRARPFPTVLDVNVTNRCNLRCAFCYNDDNRTARSDELTTDELFRLVDDAATFKAGFFLGGGEPFVRSDIYDLIGRIKARGLPVGVVTNGTLLDGRDVDRLLRDRLDVAVVSLHGTEDVHDRLVGAPGSWRKAVETLRLLARGMRAPGPMVNYVLSEASKEDLGPFLETLRGIDNVVVRLAHLSFLTPDEECAHGGAWRAAFHSTPALILNHVREAPPGIFDGLVEILEDPRNARILTKPILSPSERRSWYSGAWEVKRRCVFIWHSTLINANGDVLPCQYHGVPMGNVRDEPLADIWNNDAYREFRRVLKKGLLPGCHRCCKL
ncbi:MAG: radical SAM protein [Pseudomonadota bacterium]